MRISCIRATGCYVDLASQAACGSVEKVVSPNAMLKVFERDGDLKMSLYG